MGNITTNAHIQYKYDTLFNWSSNNPTPLSGEICVAVYEPNPPSEGEGGTPTTVTEPIDKFGKRNIKLNDGAAFLKVGDGETPFNDLPVISGVSLDVPDWAMAETKPAYSAGEIVGLDELIASKIKQDFVSKEEFQELSKQVSELAAQIQEEQGKELFLYYGTSTGKIVRLNSDLTEKCSIDLGSGSMQLMQNGLVVTESGVCALFNDRIGLLDHELTEMKSWHSKRFAGELFVDSGGYFYALTRDGIFRFGPELEDSGIDGVGNTGVSVSSFSGVARVPYGEDSDCFEICDGTGEIHVMSKTLVEIESVSPNSQATQACIVESNGRICMGGVEKGSSGFLSLLNSTLKSAYTIVLGANTVVIRLYAGKKNDIYVTTESGSFLRYSWNGDLFDYKAKAERTFDSNTPVAVGDRVYLYDNNASCIVALDPETLAVVGQSEPLSDVVSLAAMISTTTPPSEERNIRVRR